MRPPRCQTGADIEAAERPDGEGRWDEEEAAEIDGQRRVER
jgi:hypothetical protein